MDRLARLSLLVLAFFVLSMASMAVAAVWLVEPAKADSLTAATGQDRTDFPLGSIIIPMQNSQAALAAGF